MGQGKGLQCQEGEEGMGGDSEKASPLVFKFSGCWLRGNIIPSMPKIADWWWKKSSVTGVGSSGIKHFYFSVAFWETTVVSVTLYAVFKWFNTEGHSSVQITVFARFSSRNPEVKWCFIFMYIFEGELWGINAFIVASSDSI